MEALLRGIATLCLVVDMSIAMFLFINFLSDRIHPHH